MFFDIETTGLSGGAGTLAFLAGCGWFEPTASSSSGSSFWPARPGERPMLDALAAIFDDASLLVTYNGRTFDVPFMETRWAFHRARRADRRRCRTSTCCRRRGVCGAGAT